MIRATLPPENISPEALAIISSFHSSVIKEVSEAVSSHKVVVIGMAHNPFVFKMRKAFKSAGIEYKYIEYGNYWSSWKERLAIKLWSGWPTFPQVFVQGKLVGGYKDAKKLMDQGKL